MDNLNRFDLLEENEFLFDDGKYNRNIMSEIALFISRVRLRIINYLFGPIYF